MAHVVPVLALSVGLFISLTSFSAQAGFTQNIVSRSEPSLSSTPIPPPAEPAPQPITMGPEPTPLLPTPNQMPVAAPQGVGPTQTYAIPVDNSQPYSGPFVSPPPSPPVAAKSDDYAVPVVNAIDNIAGAGLNYAGSIGAGSGAHQRTSRSYNTGQTTWESRQKSLYDMR